MSFNSLDIFAFKNISATPAAFVLRGGNYGVTIHATWGGGSVTLQRLAADGATYITVTTAFAADGFVTLNLPNGQYQLLVATATAIYCDITSCAVPV